MDSFKIYAKQVTFFTRNISKSHTVVKENRSPNKRSIIAERAPPTLLGTALQPRFPPIFFSQIDTLPIMTPEFLSIIIRENYIVDSRV